MKYLILITGLWLQLSGCAALEFAPKLQFEATRDIELVEEYNREPHFFGFYIATEGYPTGMASLCDDRYQIKGERFVMPRPGAHLGRVFLTRYEARITPKTCPNFTIVVQVEDGTRLYVAPPQRFFVQSVPPDGVLAQAKFGATYSDALQVSWSDALDDGAVRCIKDGKVTDSDACRAFVPDVVIYVIEATSKLPPVKPPWRPWKMAGPAEDSPASEDHRE